MRETTFDLARGFATLRWSDSERTVRKHHASARRRIRSRACDESRGGTLTIAEGTTVPELLELRRGVLIEAHLEFADDRLAKIRLAFVRGERFTSDDWREACESAIRELFTAIDLGPFSLEEEHQSWEVGPVTVELERAGDDYALTLHRPR